MKKILTTLWLASVAIPAFCQITLDQNTYPLPTDTVTLLDVTSQVTSAPAVGNNQTWNYSSLNLSSAVAAYNLYPVVSNDANFPAAQFLSHNLLKGLTPALGYYFDQYYTINANGAQAIGIHVPAQSYGLGALTGNNTDTLYILDNVIYYPSTPRPIVAFPATAGSSWQSSVRHVVNMQLTVASASLNKTPMQQAFYYNRMDSVVGWGTLQLPTVSGFNSNLPVLQDQISQFCVDSVYVGGSPAPSTLTSAFGITQGQITGPKYNRVVMYRAGSFNYQMLFNYSDNTFSSLVGSNAVYVNTALPVATGIDDVQANTTSSAVYPNPVSDNNFSIAITGAEKPDHVTIYDVTGRSLNSSSMLVNDNTMKIEMSDALSKGIYMYNVISTDGKSIAKGKITAE